LNLGTIYLHAKYKNQEPSITSHITKCLKILEQYKKENQNLLTNEEYYKIILGLIFHDVCYFTDPQIDTSNEADSAATAVKYLHKLKVPYQHISEITGLVLATEHNEQILINKETHQLIKDIDLASGLGQPRNESIKIAHAIREEHSWAITKDFIKGRIFLYSNNCFWSLSCFCRSASDIKKASIKRLG